jgi:hypothetical protein
MGSVGPMVTLPTVDEIGMNLGVDVLSFSSGYVAWKSANTPSTLTCDHRQSPSRTSG